MIASFVICEAGTSTRAPREPEQPTAMSVETTSRAPGMRLGISRRRTEVPTFARVLPMRAPHGFENAHRTASRERAARLRERAPHGFERARRGSDIEIAHVQCVLFDELAARLDEVAHQLREDAVGFLHLLDLHLEQIALLGIHRGLPQLLGVHLTETLVALDL